MTENERFHTDGMRQLAATVDDFAEALTKQVAAFVAGFAEVAREAERRVAELLSVPTEDVESPESDRS